MGFHHARAAKVEMSEWILWACLLIGQQIGQTWTARARNTKSLSYNAIASVFSNGVWFASQFFIVKSLIAAHEAFRFALVLAFYVFFTVTGSVSAHWYLMRFERNRHVERG